MNISISDRSNYFKGLLLLIRKDRRITESEIRLIRLVGRRLGFDSHFCDIAIHDILENNYIVDVPLKFSTKELAVKFIKDGLAIAMSDNEVHPFEKEWLRSIAKINGLSLTWFNQENVNAKCGKQFISHLEVDDLNVKCS